MDWIKMWRSFRYAKQGIKHLAVYENNAKFHLLASCVAVVLGVCVQLSATEWAIICTQIGIVWAAEAFNTAIEKLCDFVSPEHRPLIGQVKDLAAGGVLLVAAAAVVVAAFIFLPKILALLT